MKGPVRTVRADGNPNITGILATAFRDTNDRESAEAILEWLNTSQPQVRWDESGIIYSPVVGLNIISYLKYLVHGNNPFSGYKPTRQERGVIKALNVMAPVPVTLIPEESDVIKELYHTSSSKVPVPTFNWVNY